MSDQIFALPDLGEGLTEAEVIEWKVKVGDTVGIDQIVVVVETAKAAVEVPCPYAGTVLTLHGEAGSVVDVGKPLITVSGGKSSANGSSTGGSGNVLVGYGTTEATGRRKRRAVVAAPVAAVPTIAKAAPLVISPIVRKLAHTNGIDVSTLAGSGLGGVITRSDVEAALVPQPTVREGLVGERIPLKGPMKAAAEKLSRSRREIPDATTWVDVDATGLMAAKTELAAGYPDHRIGVLALLAKITVAGLLKYPQLNSTVDGNDIVRLPHINLGFAAQTDRGLMVPVIKNAHLLSVCDLADEIVRLVELAKSGRLAMSDLTGGTFTLNNYGGYGVDGSTPIINHPEAAMLGIGRIIDRPWVVDGQLAVRKVAQMGLTFDHRVCDGGIAGGYLRYVADRVEKPTLLLG